MIEALLKQFTSSSHGSEAMQTLQQEHGLSEGDAQSALSAVASGAAGALSGGSGDGGGVGSLLGGLAGGGSAQALMGALGGMASGGGLAGALSGGANTMIAEKIADVVAERTSINKQMAMSIVTTALPFVMKFLQSQGEGQGGGGAPQGGGAGDMVGGLLGKLF